MISLPSQSSWVGLRSVIVAFPGYTHFFLKSNDRVKPGFIGRQGSSDRSFYVSFTAFPTDTCLERSYPCVLATNLLSDTALKICIARIITLCSHWIKASSKKNALF